MRTENHSREATLRKYRAEKAAVRRRKRSAALVSLALVGVLGIGGTVAYLFDQTTQVKNSFDASTTTIEIEEKFDGKTKSNVRVENTSDIRVYVRAKLVINWVDASGAVVANVPSDYTYTVGTIPASNSWKQGADGFYYYTLPLAPYDANSNDKDCTSALVDSIVVSKTNGEYFLSVQVLTEAIQADGVTTSGTTGVPAVTDAWGVAVNTNGTLNIA